MGCTSSQYIHNSTLSPHHFIFSFIIGKGGFGKVYSAQHIHSNEWLAIKEQKISRVLSHKNGLKLIRTELNALHVVGKHPFIVKAHFAFCDTKAFYLALDLCVGGDLRYHLKKGCLFTEQRVAFIIMCLSSALDHIHSRGVLHRDVKPENVMYNDHGFPMLTDFGVSYVCDEFASSGVIECKMASGTRPYLAPELFTKYHQHGTPSDYWSLGVLAYELLFNRRPFYKHCPHEFIDYAEEQRQLKETMEKQSHYIKSFNLTLDSDKQPAVASVKQTPPQLPFASTLLRLRNDKNSSKLPARSHSLSVPMSYPEMPVSLLTRWSADAIEGCTLDYVSSPEPSPMNKMRDTQYVAEKVSIQNHQMSHSADQPLRNTPVTSVCDGINIESGNNCNAPFESCGDSIYDISLPRTLWSVIPQESKVHGVLSYECRSVLCRLLDVRPLHRPNYSDLKGEKWFADLGYSWSGVEACKELPHYTPDLKQVGIDICSRFMFGTESNDGLSKPVSKSWVKDLQETIDNFHFISEEYTKFYSENVCGVEVGTKAELVTAVCTSPRNKVYCEE